MPTARPISVPNFEGGLFLGEKTIAKDNQLTLATNVFYNADKKLQSRYGINNFGTPVPDVAIRIHDMDTIAGNGNWAVTDDGVNLATDSTVKKVGAASLSFDITVATSANNDALFTNSTMAAVDITTAKGYIGFWLYVPTGFKTDLTDLRLRLGSGAGDYYEFTINPADITEATTNFIHKTYAGATTTGAPNDAAITYAQLRINYAAGYTNKVGIRVDDIVSYSSTSAKAMMSIKYFKASSSGSPRFLYCNVGTNLFQYDETSTYWTLVKPSLTENKRFGFMAYKNICYFGNGSDNNFDITTTGTITEHTGANTYKTPYMLNANDVGYALGDPSVPSSLVYTGATPANFRTFPNVLVLDEDDSSGKGTGLTNLGAIVIAAKEKKIYKVNIATPSREQLDYSDGVASHRSFMRTENEVFMMNGGGIYTLSQREATTGSLRADALTDDIQALIDLCRNKSTVCSFYAQRFSNAYVAIDTNDDDKPDTCIVYSILTRKFTTYSGVNANEFVLYEDSSGVEHLLFANALGGQCMEMESGTNDNGVSIASEVDTKAFDFDQPSLLKTFEHIDVNGFINEGGKLEITAIIDDEYETPVATVDGSNYVTASGASYTLGTSPLGTTTLGGAVAPSGTSITLYPFKIRIPIEYTGVKIRVKFVTNYLDTVFIPTKLTVFPNAQPIELFEADYIA